MAVDKYSMAVGHIPSLTWHRISMNEGLVPAGYRAGAQADVQWTGPARTQLSMMEAEAKLAQIAHEEPPEKIVAGKVPIYHPQYFGTGLGAEMDEALLEGELAVDYVDIPEGTESREAARMTIRAARGRQACAAQILHLGAGSSMTLIMDAQTGTGSAADAGRDMSTLSISTKIVMEAGAKLTLVKIQTLDSGFLSLDDLGVSMAENSELKLVIAELGGAQAFRGIQVEQNGRGACLTGGMAYLALRDQKVDINYNVIQRGAATKSEMNFDGVLSGRAQKSFRGTIDFRGGAVGAQGDEQENVLLLSQDIVNRTLPIILCEEEDVEGRHGATIGKLDEDMLFYMASRGIDERQAQRIMVRARVGAVLRQIPDEEMRCRLGEYVEEALTDESIS